jgi:predicted HTH domain antitoxin
MESGNLIEKEIRVISNTGLYKSGDDFLKDAVNTLLAARKDVRVAIARELYKRGEISFGKACEIASVDMEEMKEILHKNGIGRKSELKIKETEYLAEEAVKFAGRK